MIYSADAINHFHQPLNGYHFSADSIYLADQADFQNARTAADFGAGCGIVGLCALEKKKPDSLKRLFFVEREQAFFPSLKKNIELYQPHTNAGLSIISRDWRDLTPEDFGGPIDYVLANPPYFSPNSRPSPNPVRDAARRELHGNLNDLVEVLKRLISPAGRALIVTPARYAETDARFRFIAPPRVSRPHQNQPVF